MAERVTKIARLRACWEAGDRFGALRIAARFGDLGAERGAILSGWNAHLRPAFYLSIGKSPDELLAAAFEAIERRYKLGP